MTVSELLTVHGYIFDVTALVWHRPEADFIGYSDGDDTEQKLEAIVKSVADRSVDSAAWSSVINDWPTEYHFSAKRANLLRPLPIGIGQRVVELGAGCGAITRWLGETGAEVIAIEGSLQRAKIAALRCQDLVNVHIVADNLHATPPFSADWVTLIGVLEYSPVFDPSADPVAAVLGVARRHLKPNGALIVAIENQLGLKYFAGCGEDHVGIPYFGIEGLYRTRGAITFGRSELSERLLSVGLSSQKLLLPFPDYKLPDLLIEASACERQDFDAASFVALCVGRDYSGQRAKAFTEPLAWTAVARNGILPDLSNSFLFVAAQDQSSLADRSPTQDTLAWSYSGDRSSRFATETCINSSDEGLRVLKSPRQSNTHSIRQGEGQWSQCIVPVSDYFSGERLDIRLIRSAASGDTDEFFKCASKWFDELLVRSSPVNAMAHEKIETWNSEGRAVDLIPRNIIVGAGGELHIFDLEWVCSKPVPLSWLLIRGILSFALYPINGEWIRSQTVVGLARAVAARHNLSVSDADVEIARRTDASFLAWVRDQDAATVCWPLELLTRPIGQLTESIHDFVSLANTQAAADRREVRTQLDAERIAHAKLIGAYEQSEKSNQSLIDELNKAHAFAADALAHKTLAERRVADVEHAISNLTQRLALSEEDFLQRETEFASKVVAYEEAHALAIAEQDALTQALNQAETEQQQLRALINLLEQQQVTLNAELIKLNAERGTFGAKLGRAITRLRARAAPLGTRRGVAVTLIGKFANTLYVSGWKTTAAKSYRHVSFRLQSKRVQKNSARALSDHEKPTDAPASYGEGQANHPQLSAWIDGNEPTPEQLTAQSVEGLTFGYRPLLSVIIPIYRVPREVLDETLASLERQTYTYWQACIVWADTDDSSGWDWLQARVNGDTRFKLKLLSENGGISQNSNAAFELVDGDFIALLDHDDTLTPWAFFEITKRLQTSPELDFIYSDKDSITADGQIRLNALFKPGWSPEMLHSVNYLTHLNIIRTSLVREIGGWRAETDGAQDWDLFFRITERTRNIAHLPSILYHWRILPTSTATGLQAKPYAALGQLKSQQDHFMRRGLAASVVPSPEGMFKVCWPVHKASIDVVVFQNGTLGQLVAVLDALRAGKQEIIRHIYVAHRTPANDALNAFHRVWQDRITFTHTVNVNWRTALEAALLEDNAETVLLLDGSAAGISETLAEELGGWVAQHPDIAWASAIALNPDGTVYEAGRVVSEDHQSAPMFRGSSLFSFGWFGGPLWYRNARSCSPYAVAIDVKNIRAALSQTNALDGGRNDFSSLCRVLTANGRRGLIDPFAKVFFNVPPEQCWPNDGHLFHSDPYFNPAFAQVSPLRLKL